MEGGTECYAHTCKQCFPKWSTPTESITVGVLCSSAVCWGALLCSDLSDNQLSGPLPSGFSSPYVGTSQGTYRVSLNFFSGAAEVRAADEAGTKEQTKVCPRYQGGTYAKAKLAILGLSVYGTMRKNCLDGGKSAPDDLWGTGAGGGREAVLAQATPEMVAACDVEIQRREAECVGFCGTGAGGRNVPLCVTVSL